MIRNLTFRLLTWRRPVKLSDKLHRSGNDLLLSFSPQRSGQHLVIHWLCLGLGEILHVNHARLVPRLRGPVLLPYAGRTVLYGPQGQEDSGKRAAHSIPNIASSAVQYRRELWSLEDIAPDNPCYTFTGGTQPCLNFVILRDPANWLASSMKRKDWGEKYLRQKMDIYYQTLKAAELAERRDDTLIVRFNDFITDPASRVALSARIKGHDLSRAEPALVEIPDFGGGSSFDGRSNLAGHGVGERWRSFANYPLFRDLLSRDGLRPLAARMFGVDHLTFLDASSTRR